MTERDRRSEMRFLRAMVLANVDESQRRLRELADRERRARRRPRR
jgi:hypothetical protein